MPVGYGRRAAAAEPSDHFAYYTLPFAQMSRTDVPALQMAHGGRAGAGTQSLGRAMAGIAMFTAFVGEWQRGWS
jgi:hypothetical protein